jgi:hypothetical protein
VEEIQAMSKDAISYVKKSTNDVMTKMTIVIPDELLNSINGFLNHSHALRSSFITNALKKHLEFLEEGKETCLLKFPENWISTMLSEGNQGHKKTKDIMVKFAVYNIVTETVYFIVDMLPKHHNYAARVGSIEPSDCSYNSVRCWTNSWKSSYRIRTVFTSDLKEWVQILDLSPHSLEDTMKMFYDLPDNIGEMTLQDVESKEFFDQYVKPQTSIVDDL